ncbi:Riboflavin transporter MCH5 [Penicillium subrubescens]|uniref:Riboflavin transporter MCH5 n=2 Tax=Penicillium subrubescens TaxID=1316194 RepID=A0A1Q5UEL6_9EURO|nr:Riboflavin transporter MCH5 [Penicillium subrubescens]
MDSKRTIAVSGDGAQEEDSIGQMDHGVRAWTVVIGAWCCLFCGFGWVNVFLVESSPGYLGDKLGRYNVMIAMCSLSSIVILALWLPGTLLSPGSVAVYVIFSMLYGFASGAFVGMVPALLSQISPDVTKIGVRQGVLFTCISIASLTGSPIAGAILSRQNGTYWGLQVFAGAMMGAGVFFFTAGRIVLAGTSIAKKI